MAAPDPNQSGWQYYTNPDEEEARSGRRRQPDPPKPYACEMCSRSFARPSTLATHMLSHTGERPHVCPFCRLRFTSTSNKYRHMRGCPSKPDSVNVDDGSFIPLSSSSAPREPGPSRSAAEPAVLTRGGAVISFNNDASQRSKSTSSSKNRSRPKLQSETPPIPSTSTYRNNPPDTQRRVRLTVPRSTHGNVDGDSGAPSNWASTDGTSSAQPRSPIPGVSTVLPTSGTSADEPIIQSRPTPHTTTHPGGQGPGSFFPAPNLPTGSGSSSVEDYSAAGPSTGGGTQYGMQDEEGGSWGEYEYDGYSDEIESDDENHVHDQRQFQMSDIRTADSTLPTAQGQTGPSGASPEPGDLHEPSNIMETEDMDREGSVPTTGENVSDQRFS